MDREFFMRNLWRWAVGQREEQPNALDATTPEALQQSEWSPEFEHLMRNRLVMGALRYGRMGHGAHPVGKPVYDRAASIRRRLVLFERTGNGEHLVDIANEALLIFEERQHPQFHFAQEDGGYHTQPK